MHDDTVRGTERIWTRASFYIGEAVRALRHNVPTLTLLSILLIGYIGLWGIVRLLSPLPESAYQGASLLVGGMATPLFAVAVTVPLLLLFWARDELRWEHLPHGTVIRVFVLLTAFPLVWSLISSEYNFLFAQVYHVDRIIILAMYCLVCVHPAFAFPLLMSIVAFEGQFMHPFGGISSTNSQLPMQVLAMFSAFLFLRIRHHPRVQKLIAWTGTKPVLETDFHDTRLLFWAVAGLIGGSYFWPGMNKALALWPFREQLALYIPFSYLRGWLTGILSPALVEQLYGIVSTANPLMTVGAMLIELSAVALAWGRRRTMYAVIALFISLHMMIFLLTGILFKMWIIVLLGFAFVAHRIETSGEDLFTRRTAVIVTAIIILSGTLFSVSPLVWFQTNHDRVYTLELVDTDGETYDVGWGQMSPFGITFKQNRFAYLDEGRVLEASRATNDYAQLQQLLEIDTLEELQDLREREGAVKYRPERAAAFDRFIRDYVDTRWNGRERMVGWNLIPYLPHLYWGSPGERIPGNSTFTHVLVRKTPYIYTAGNIRSGDSEIVRNIILR